MSEASGRSGTLPVQPPALPHTWRPFGTRMAGVVFGAMLVAVIVAAWVGFSSRELAAFTTLEKVTMVFVALLAIACWYAVVRPRLTASGSGLTVVNGYRRRDFEWAQVLDISLRRGAPWASLDLSDGTTVSVLAIQGSDGARARRAVREVRALIGERTPQGR